VLARVEEGDRLLRVQAVGRRDDDGVDAGIADELAPIGRRARDPALGRKAGQRLGPPGTCVTARAWYAAMNPEPSTAIRGTATAVTP
jgi:hypothetical protein